MSTTKDHKIILKCIGSGAKKVIKEIVGSGKGPPDDYCFKSSMPCQNGHSWISAYYKEVGTW